MNFSNKLKQLFLAVAFLLLLSLGSRVEISLSVVNITLQTLILLVAYRFLKLPYRLGLIFTYILLGGFGLPVFNGGVGFEYVFSTPIGFFMGFILATFIPVNSTSFKRLLGYFLLAHSIILLFGMIGLMVHFETVKSAISIITPLIAGAVVKSLIGSGIVKALNEVFLNVE